jgi:5-methyltetrahydrofolate--homocysteine methyltransferase
VLLATVKGDVHDIGKNLVDIILRNNGYDVVNLGIKQPIDAIIAAAEEHDCDAIGMSGLLVKSTVIMKENLEELNDRGLATTYPVLLGGAALTRGYVEDDLRAIYEGEVFYCKDAFEGLRVLDAVMEARADRGCRLPQPRARTSRWRAGSGPVGRVAARRGSPSGDTDASRRSPAPRPTRRPGTRRAGHAPPSPPTSRSPTPPFWGQRTVRGIPVGEVAPLLNEVALFRNQWGFTPGRRSPDEYAGPARARGPAGAARVARPRPGGEGRHPGGRLRLLPRQRRRRRPGGVGPRRAAGA